jgi:hypothetical protein
VAQRHLQHRARGQLEPPRRLAEALHHQRQHVERRALPARPAERERQLGEVGVAGVADHGPVRQPVAGVADELLVPDHRAVVLGRGGGER